MSKYDKWETLGVWTSPDLLHFIDEYKYALGMSNSGIINHIIKSARDNMNINDIIKEGAEKGLKEFKRLVESKDGKRGWENILNVNTQFDKFKRKYEKKLIRKNNSHIIIQRVIDRMEELWHVA